MLLYNASFYHYIETVEVNWPIEIKPNLYFSHRLNAKTVIFVLSLLFTGSKFSHKIFSEEAAVSILNMDMC